MRVAFPAGIGMEEQRDTRLKSGGTSATKTAGLEIEKRRQMRSPSSLDDSCKNGNFCTYHMAHVRGRSLAAIAAQLSSII